MLRSASKTPETVGQKECQLHARFWKRIGYAVLKRARPVPLRQKVYFLDRSR